MKCFECREKERTCKFFETYSHNGVEEKWCKSTGVCSDCGTFVIEYKPCTGATNCKTFERKK